jgi:DNA-binding NarL/FixJ family response regulator
MRVFEVDDHEVFRDGLRTVVESIPDGQIVAEASTAREACNLIDSTGFDVMIVDVSMPGVNGLSLVREVRRREYRQPILVLTMYTDADVAAEALAAGATGFTLKSDPRAALRAAIVSVAQGERYLASSLSADNVNSLLAPGDRAISSNGALAVLTVREREVFDLLARGYNNDAVAAELYISVSTVQTHRVRVFRKLELHSIGDLLRLSFRNRCREAGFDHGGHTAAVSGMRGQEPSVRRRAEGEPTA